MRDMRCAPLHPTVQTKMRADKRDAREAVLPMNVIDSMAARSHPTVRPSRPIASTARVHSQGKIIVMLIELQALGAQRLCSAYPAVLLLLHRAVVVLHRRQYRSRSLASMWSNCPSGGGGRSDASSTLQNTRTVWPATTITSLPLWALVSHWSRLRRHVVGSRWRLRFWLYDHRVVTGTDQAMRAQCARIAWAESGGCAVPRFSAIGTLVTALSEPGVASETRLSYTLHRLWPPSRQSDRHASTARSPSRWTAVLSRSIQ
jgi:hypothetical protein